MSSVEQLRSAVISRRQIAQRPKERAGRAETPSLCRDGEAGTQTRHSEESVYDSTLSGDVPALTALRVEVPPGMPQGATHARSTVSSSIAWMLGSFGTDPTKMSSQNRRFQS